MAKGEENADREVVTIHVTRRRALEMLAAVGLGGASTVMAGAVASCEATSAPKTTPNTPPATTPQNAPETTPGQNGARVAAPPPRGVLGANMNGDQNWSDFAELDAVGATWLMSPWFAANSGFLRDQVGTFRATGRLAVAAYGITQDTAMAAHFGPDSPPWALNSLFCPYTVQPGQNGLPGQTTAWTQEFRTLQ